MFQAFWKLKESQNLHVRFFVHNQELFAYTVYTLTRACAQFFKPLSKNLLFSDPSSFIINEV